MKVAVINDTRPTHHYGCMLVMENLLRLLQENGAEVVWTWPVSVDWRRHKRRIRKMPDVDAIIINGEGTIHHNTDRRFSQALIDFVSFSKHELKKPCYLINATLHANSKSAYEQLAHARAIYVRDRGSLKELNEFGKLNGSYVPDMTFASNSAHKKNSFNIGQKNKTLIVDSAVKQDSLMLEALAMKHGYDFRSMVVARPSNARFLRSPRPWVKNVVKWLKSDRHIATDAGSYIEYLQQYSMVITGRYHTVTMCLKNRIPFISLESNTPKVRYLLTDVLGAPDRSLKPEQVEDNNVGHLKEFSEDELASIAAFTAGAEASIANMITSICSDVLAGASDHYRY